MGCSCRERRAASGQKIVAYDYVPPGGGEPIRFLTQLEAKKEQTRRAGGTIYGVTNP